MDIFYVYALPILPASSTYYVNTSEFLALVSCDTHEIIGFQVERFRSMWVKSHPELQAQARKAATPIAHPLLRRFNGAWANFTTAVVRSLTGALKDAPPHARLSC